MHRQFFRMYSFCMGLLFFALNPMQAQLSPYQNYQELYNEAVELFEKGHYSAAQQKAESYLAAEEALRGDAFNDLHANASFIVAVSAFHLERNNTESILKDFIHDYSDNSKSPQVQYYLGKYFFNRKDYRKAVQPFNEAYNAGNLPISMNDELTFLLAYSHFMEGRNVQATRYFAQLANRENPYKEDAAYYQSVILYQDKEYESAYIAFKELEKSDKYGNEIRVYMANTLLKLKRYDELYVLADELISGPRLKGKDAQVYYVVANASFERNDYNRTAEYFSQYVKNRGKLNKSDYFRYAYSLYQQNQFAEAIPVFQRAQGGKDSLEQVASYYLGFCYLKQNDEPNAKFAFETAAKKHSYSNPTLLQDALYQYAKVSFATKAYDDARRALIQIVKDYPTVPHINEVKAMIGETHLYTRNYPASIRYFESIPRNTNRMKEVYQLVCFYYGLELFEKPNYKQSQVYFQKAVDNNYDADIALGAQYWLGEARFRRGDFQGAKSAYQTYLSARNARKNEYYARAFLGIGWSEFKLKNYNSAIKGFDQFLANGRNEDKNLMVDAHLRTGDCHFISSRYDKAIASYKRVIDFRYTYRDYATYQIAEAYYRKRQYNTSVQNFDKLISSYKSSEFRDNALDRISEIYLTWLSNDSKAIQYSNILVKDYPRSPLAGDAYSRLAIAAFNQGDQNNAVTYFKKILSDFPSDKKNTQVALESLSSLLSEREYDKLLKDFREANPDTDNNLASILFNNGKDRFFSMNYSAAIEQFSDYIKSYKNGPDYYEAYLFRARSYREKGQFAKALSDYEAIYSTQTVNPFTNLALLEAAEIRYEQGEYMSSLKLYETLDRLAGKVQNRVQARFGMAKNYKAMKDYDQAVSTLRTITTNNEVTVYSRTKAAVEIGHCYYLKGDLERALVSFSEVERDFKNEFGAESQYMIVKIFYEQGKQLQGEGNTEMANGKFEETKEAGIYQKNAYPSFNEWKARSFLIVAEANYELGEVFQAKGVLQGLAEENRFPDVQTAAKTRLAEIEAEENSTVPSGGR